jgi:hypothetical protein
MIQRRSQPQGGVLTAAARGGLVVTAGQGYNPVCPVEEVEAGLEVAERLWEDGAPWLVTGVDS